jgi:hypothetical protein
MICEVEMIFSIHVTQGDVKLKVFKVKLRRLYSICPEPSGLVLTRSSSLSDIEVSIQVSRGVLLIIHSPAETEAPTQVSRNVLSILKDLVGVLNRKYNYEDFLRK